MAINFAAGSQTAPAKLVNDAQFIDVSTSDIGSNTSSFIAVPGDVGNGNATITPSASSSKIIVHWSAHAGHETSWRSVCIKLQQAIGSGSFTDVDGCGSNSTTNNSYVVGGNTMCRTIMLSPNTTQAVKYRLVHQGHASGGTYHHNQIALSNSVTNTRNTAGAIIYLQEVLA